MQVNGKRPELVRRKVRGNAWAEAFIVVSRNGKVRQGKQVRIG